MPIRPKNFANINEVKHYDVEIEFTDRYEPVEISEHSLPFFSLSKEIDVNLLSQEAKNENSMDEYLISAPLYLWELQNGEGRELLYIGQTVHQQMQRKIEGHSSIIKLLAQYVNDPTSFVYYRICNRLEISYEEKGRIVVRAIEHFSLDQAHRIIDDIEAHLIYQCKPKFNTHYKNKEKDYWKPFSIRISRNISIP